MSWIAYRWQSELEHQTGGPLPPPSPDAARILDRMEEQISRSDGASGGGGAGRSLRTSNVFVGVLLAMFCYHLLIFPLVVLIHGVAVVALVGGGLAGAASALRGSPAPAPASAPASAPVPGGVGSGRGR